VKFPIRTAPGIALGIILLAAAVSVTHALGYGGLTGAVLRVGELPAEFNNTATRVYTKDVDYLRVKVRNGSTSGELTCQTPNKFVAGPYRQAMMQGFGHTGLQLSDARVCSYLYATVSGAHKAFVGLSQSAVGDAKLYGSKLVPSRLGSESALVAGKSLDEMVFRKDTYVAKYFYGDFSGLKMSRSSFAGLGSKLLSRLH
jgi:hypothetical protein